MKNTTAEEILCESNFLRFQQTSLFEYGRSKVTVPHKQFCFDNKPDLLFIYIWPGPCLCLTKASVIDPFAEVTSPRDAI